MISDHETEYRIILTEKEVSSLIEEINSIYKGVLEDGNSFESINTLLTLKDILVLEMQK